MIKFEPLINTGLLIGVAALVIIGSIICLCRSNYSKRIGWVRRILMILLVFVILMRPLLSGGVLQKGMTLLDVYFVVDLSPSAIAEDYNGKETRLTGMKSDIKALISQHSGARFSIISFDTSAHITLPLTTDATMAISTTDTLQPAVPRFGAAGSSIDSGLSALEIQLQTSKKLYPERKRLVYYLGDGEQTVDKIPRSFSEIKNLISSGAVLGYGTDAGGKMLREDPINPSEVAHIQYNDDNRSYIDENNLQKIATQMDVPYFHRTRPDDASEVMRKIDIRSIATDFYDRDSYIEIYWWFALILAFLLIWELIGLTSEYSSLRQPKGGQS